MCAMSNHIIWMQQLAGYNISNIVANIVFGLLTLELGNKMTIRIMIDT